MYFAAVLVSMMASGAMHAAATPAAFPGNTVNLDNGKGTVETAYGPSAPGSPPAQSKVKRGGYCSGSSECSNGQDQKNACSGAYSRIGPTTYRNGGEYVVPLSFSSTFDISW